MTAHVIPVPDGMDWRDAWAEIRRFGSLLDEPAGPVRWCVVAEDDR